MIRENVNQFAAIRRPVLTTLFVIGLVGSTPFPLLAQTSGAWTTTGSLNTPRQGHTATLLQNGDVLVVGGEDTSQNILASAELYNPATGKWTITSSMTTARTNTPQRSCQTERCWSWVGSVSLIPKRLAPGPLSCTTHLPVNGGRLEA